MADEFYGHFTRCIDLIHNPFRAVNYRDIILPLLFYKIASDTYRDVRDEVEGRVGPEVASEAIWYDVVIPRSYSWEEVCEVEGSLSDSILEGYDRLSSANTDSFGEIHPIDADQLRKLEDGRLGALVDHLSSRNLSKKRTPPEKLGLYFQRLASHLHSVHRGSGRYLPSPRMSSLLSSLLDPDKPGSKVHDPVCGVGALLAKTAQSIRKSKDDLDLSQFAFSGQDTDLDLLKIVRMNLYANQVDCRLQLGGVPIKPAFATGGSSEHFDFVVSSLIPRTPDVAFGKYRDWHPKLDGWTYKGNDLGLARLIHGVSRLSKDGRGVYLVPTSSLMGREVARLREYLLGNDLLDAVIGFPEGHGGDEHRRSILVVDRSKLSRHLDEIFFVKLDRSLFRSGLSDELELTGEGVERINAIVESHIEKEGVSCTVGVGEVKSRRGGLNPGEYIGN